MEQEISSGGGIYRTNNGLVEVLLIRIRKDQYELPKGHVENGETKQQAAIRECYEETGFTGKFEIDKYLDEIDYTFESNSGHINKKVTYFSVKIVNEGEFNKPRDTRELRWIQKAELGNIEFVSEALKHIVMTLIN